MSAPYDSTSGQHSGVHKPYGVREHDGSGPKGAAPVPQAAHQPPRLPSLGTWARASPPSHANPLPAYLENNRDSVNLSRQYTSYAYPATHQQHHQSQFPDAYGPRPNFPTTTNPESGLLRQDQDYNMCFRGGSYWQVNEVEEQPRPMVQKAPPGSVGSRGYIIRNSPASSSSTFLQRDVHPKRQAYSPEPQDQTAKRVREQSPPRIRRPIRVRDPVPNLLGPSKAHLVRSLRFSLRIRQQPAQARSCGFADKDRRAIDPPPIVQLQIKGEGLSDADLDTYLRHDRYVMICTLVDDKGKDAMNLEQDGLRSKRMMGECSAVPFVGTDEHGEIGCFFAFNDLSCRTPGDYRLSFSVSVVPTLEESKDGIRYPRIDDITSDIFRAYNAKMFPGMTESSPLARALKEQGCNISVRKGNEKTKNPRGRQVAQQEDEDDDEDD
ncbi:velvet factor domain-containing protein [Sarocladium implicatum]|nr:velvet factor domain-containing protein [Sarocladium implicatum]